MGLQKRSVCSVPLTITVVLLNVAAVVFCGDKFSRQNFPPYFVFGAATSAPQVEGAAFEDGKSPSIWDTFAHSGRMGGENGDVASDEYHKYKEDVKLMAETGLEAYKFSVAWSRLIPNGRGPLNPKGLQYYNNLIDELIKHGIQPCVTLVHADIPQVLEDEYGGWISRKIITDFTDYADVCFREFGDRVLHWTTINDPNMVSLGGYDQGITPPGRCSSPFGSTNCSKGNSINEPYLAHHHMLLAHAAAVRLYRERYQDKQHGLIGNIVYTFGLVPGTESKEDKIAAERAFDFYIGWDLEPLVNGDYPPIMKKIAGPKLPAFTKWEAEQVKGSFDFIGIIYYASVKIRDKPNSLKPEQRDFVRDTAVTYVGPGSAHVDPESSSIFQGLLGTLKERYGNPPIFILENGMPTTETSSNSSPYDVTRVKYLHTYIGGVLDALRNGSDIRGYFVWSFIDLFELFGAYKESYGLYYVDRKDPDLKRYPKLSAHWYSRFLDGRSVSPSATLALNHESPISVSRLFEEI